ncbi:hypothetical protein B0H10DRAFT_1946904 [Mycena sp. CBHHK59/15]|nr:hypothetical protein B0H10DRAFT_1946904 [Mycena sp. CBHHK59/15]
MPVDFSCTIGINVKLRRPVRTFEVWREAAGTQRFGASPFVNTHRRMGNSAIFRRRMFMGVNGWKGATYLCPNVNIGYWVDFALGEFMPPVEGNTLRLMAINTDSSFVVNDTCSKLDTDEGREQLVVDSDGAGDLTNASESESMPKTASSPDDSTADSDIAGLNQGDVRGDSVVEVGEGARAEAEEEDKGLEMYIPGHQSAGLALKPRTDLIEASRDMAVIGVVNAGSGEVDRGTSAASEEGKVGARWAKVKVALSMRPTDQDAAR